MEEQNRNEQTEQEKLTPEEMIRQRKGCGPNGCLVPMSERSPEERKAITNKGGQATKEKFERQRSAKEVMRALLALKVKAGQRKGLGEYAELLPEGATMLDLLSLVQMREAENGSSKAYEIVRDTAGYKPIEQHEITAEVMTDADRDLLRAVAARTGADQGEK